MPTATDRASGFTWQQDHGTFTTDANSEISIVTGVPAPNGILWVGAIEIDVFGFTNGHWYTWIASADDTTPVLAVYDSAGLVGPGIGTACSVLWLCY